MTRSTIKPPTMTMANGRCESEPMAWDSRRRQQAQRGHQHGHHDRPQPAHRAFNRGLLDGKPARAQLVDVLHHDDAGLHRNAEQRQESDARRDAEVRARDLQRQQAAHRAPRTTLTRLQQRPLGRAERGVNDHEDEEDGQRHDDQQPRLGALLALVFALPVDVVAARQLAPACLPCRWLPRRRRPGRARARCT